MAVPEKKLRRLDREEIDHRLAMCPALPSLSSINQALQSLLQAEQRYSEHIAEIIRRDPSLTSRLLRLVNSIYYGLAAPVSSIEEAVFYLGVRQIWQLTTVTPVIEDFHRLSSRCQFPWRQFWQHCIGTAILTREIVSLGQAPADESEYVAGLVHDVGKIIMAWSFPEHFAEVHRQAAPGQRDLIEIENDVVGVDHAELGARYLERHHLPAPLVDTVRFHHQPEKAENHPIIVAAAHIADLLMRNAQIGCSGNYLTVTDDQCLRASSWRILFPNSPDAGAALAHEPLRRSLERLPRELEGLV